MSRENCTNDATTITFLVTAPWLDVSFSRANSGRLTLHLNAVGDLASKAVTLYTTNDLSLLVPEADLPTKTMVLSPAALVAPVSTTPTGVSRYFIKEIMDRTQSPGFFRVRIAP